MAILACQLPKPKSGVILTFLFFSHTTFNPLANLGDSTLKIHSEFYHFSTRTATTLGQATIICLLDFCHLLPSWSSCFHLCLTESVAYTYTRVILLRYVRLCHPLAKNLPMIPYSTQNNLRSPYSGQWSPVCSGPLPPLWPCPLTRSTPVTLACFAVPQTVTKHMLSSSPLHLLFLLPGKLFPPVPIWLNPPLPSCLYSHLISPLSLLWPSYVKFNPSLYSYPCPCHSRNPPFFS